MRKSDYDEDDPDKHLKRLQRVIGVSARIVNLAVTRMSMSENKTETKAQKKERILKTAIEDRASRLEGIKSNDKATFDMLCYILGIKEDDLIEFYIDSDQNIAALRNTYEMDGERILFVQHQIEGPPSMESGRYDEKLENEKFMSFLFSNGKGNKVDGRCVVMYRTDNSESVEKGLENIFYFLVLSHEASVVASLSLTIDKALRPALDALSLSSYGGNAADKNTFVYGVESFVKFLDSTHECLTESSIHFHVDNDIFRGFLLVDFQIEETSIDRKRVALVEVAFERWMRQIKVVISQGNQLALELTNHGPLRELEHWRKMLAKFAIVEEFTQSKPFRHYFQCLKMSKSKLISLWSEIDETMRYLMMEAKDNLKFLTSIEEYWDPLYRLTPNEISKYIYALLKILRSVFKSATFLKTNMRITSFLSKVSNQLIKAAQKYLTNNKTISIWTEKMSTLVIKINECDAMQKSFRSNYAKTLEEMKESGEIPFECSTSYLFDRLDVFMDRLRKIHEIMHICLRFQELRKAEISGLNPFRERIEKAFKYISTNPNYDPLAYRDKLFDKDYMSFHLDVTKAESEMEVYVMEYTEQIPLVPQRVLTLQRFVHLLDYFNLKLGNRFIEVARMLTEEIETIKDKYDEERGNPPAGRLIPLISGQIMWIRSLHQKLRDPLAFLIKINCVYKHDVTQSCVKMYNFLAPLFLQYEATTHKAWYDYVDQVRSCLEVPILRKNFENNHYIINFDPYILEAIKETEAMNKFGLKVPQLPAVLACCKDRLLSLYETTKHLLERNDNLRNSIYPIFIPMMRIHLIKLERVFAPALSIMTWLSLDIDDYFIKVRTVLRTLENFVKEISDINDVQIGYQLEGMKELSLIYLPDEPVTSTELKDLNTEHREKMESIIELKSSSAEKAAVDLINLFVRKADHIPFCEHESGKFQLPLEEINDENKRVEEFKPINKYDWLSFDKVYKPVSTPENVEELCFKDYDGLVYDITLLHIDCVELFAHYNHKLIDLFAKLTKRSMERLKDRTNVIVSTYDCYTKEDFFFEFSYLKSKPAKKLASLISTSVVLEIPNFKISPSIEELNATYHEILKNIFETFHKVTAWGFQAKIEERSNRRIMLAEIRFSRVWYQKVIEHKDISRYKIEFDIGIMQLKGEIDKFLVMLYEKYNYLWTDKREKMIEDFVESKPTPVTPVIKDKINFYDELTESLGNTQKYHCLGIVQLDLTEMIDVIVAESQEWKVILGTKLCNFFRDILRKNSDFIKTNIKILSRNINDLDDCSIAMNALNDLRDNYYETDFDIDLLKETYEMLKRKEIDIPIEDLDINHSLRNMFESLKNEAAISSARISVLQEPLLKELITGVEIFKEEVTIFDNEYIKDGPMVEGIAAKVASDRVLMFDSKLDTLQHQYEVFSNGERLFGLPVNEYPVLQKRKREINFLNRLYKLYLDVMRTFEEYSQFLFQDINMEKINTEIQEFVNRCRTLPKAMKNWPAFIDLKKAIDDFYECCPLIELMSAPAMKERHWKDLEKALNYEFNIHDETFTLGYVLEAPLLRYRDTVEEICICAAKEQDIEAKLNAVMREWKDIILPLTTYKNRGEVLIKASDLQDITLKLEDSNMIMSSLASNRFNGHFKKTITLWQHKLSDANQILELWLQVQNLWTYLEVVFFGGDIARQLPIEAKRFSDIDKRWTYLMYGCSSSRIIDVCNEDMLTNLRDLLMNLESCQKSLIVYLEQKRLIFPRFFFLSDPVLLEILGQGSDPNSIQPHLLSIFDGVAAVEFTDMRYTTICTMKSSNGEGIPLLNNVKCLGLVEVWIQKLLESVLETIKDILGNVGQQISDAKFDYTKDLSTLCAQAQLICVQLLWTKDAEYALNNCKKDKKVMATKNAEFEKMLQFLVNETIKDLTKLERISYETLVTIHVHQRDIFDGLVKSKIKNAQDFEWQKQARFYFDLTEEEVVVKITDIIFTYQNEYLGVTDRLAITPLTDRCYITLAQAIGMNMGGAPAGPAGTGKTETTKDMGRALGKFVVVFNCSDQMDYRGLGRLFKGLAQSGSWGCFDEFNRIELPVLSVAAQQISIVLNAKKEKEKKFVFSDGVTVDLNPEFGIFITMNPGYAGRQELPENLKIQFRTVAMMVPDRQIIMRVKLASCGFQDNEKLASKFYTLYKLCEEQLSKQVHYDFGLRNILSVLRTLGAAKRSASGKYKEDIIVMQVLRDMNQSKLVDEDEPLFRALIGDLFPTLDLPPAERKDLQASITKAANNLQFIRHDKWVHKIVQLYETSLVRHGLMVLGPSGAGKTACISTLLESLTIQGLKHKEIRMNPKAITASQMFGRLDVTTNDWTDGIFSCLWRRTLKFKDEFVWLILDGPVDAVWIENLNSVLDDNKTLTLANGDRIVMSPNCKLVFEPDKIDNASPATVSRMGMVFMSSSVMPWKAIFEKWLLKRSAEQSKILRTFFNKIYDDLHFFIQTKLKAKMAVLEALYIRQTCDLLTGLLNDSLSYTNPHLERIFLFSLMWSLGAILELDDREKMQEFVLKHPSKMKWPRNETGESIFEFLVDDNGNWEHWNSRIEEYIYPSDSVPDYSSILVPNVDNVRTAFLIDTIAKQKKAVLLIGEQGTAKTVMMKSYMSNTYDSEKHLSKSFNLSSATTPNMFQRIVESYVEKRMGLTYGPPQMRKMTIFIDDIAMPKINEWGDQITNEIVRQLMECSGFYSLDRPGDFLTISDVQFVAAMIHAGGGRNDIPTRLKRQFNIFNCTLPSNKSMDKIFGVIGNGYFCSTRFNSQITKFISNLIPLTRILWQQTKIKMLPTPAKFHYVWNLRDLSRIWGGILKIEGDQCKTISSLLKLWSHECTRVVSDRFINSEDQEWFKLKMHELAKRELGDVYTNHFPQTESFFVDFLRDEPEAEGENQPEEEVPAECFIYEEIPSFEMVTERVYMLISQYNQEVRGSKLDIVLFQDALVHLIKISRILRTARGNALLVGVGGSGKQSLTKLASHIAGYKFHQITLTRAYNANNFADEFKYLYRIAGLNGNGITFIFTDNDIKDESFLEYLNNVLSSGEIANLFAKDEIEEILNELIPVMKKVDPKRIPSMENLYDFFITRARNNLHVVLCFSPLGEKFRTRALKFPGLISGSMINWFQKWPVDALTAVAQHLLRDFEIKCSTEVKSNLVKMMAFVQDNVSETCSNYYERFRRQTHVTPKSFLAFISGYKSIYKENLHQIEEQSMRMSNGLGKLQEAADSIDKLKKLFEVKKVEISAAETNAQEVIKNVEKSRQIASKAQIEIQGKRETQQILVEKITEAEKISTRELAKTLPQLQMAEDALNTIKSQDLAVVRRLGKPPHLITVIMDCVLILSRKKIDRVTVDPEKNFIKTSWNESLKMMGDINFLKKIREFKRDSMIAETIDLLQPYFRYPQYSVEAAMSACSQVAGLLKWTKAMADFYNVNVNVIPLKADVAMKQMEQKKAEAELMALEEIFALRNAEVQAAENEHRIASDALQKVKDDAALLQSKLDAANAMISGLSDERKRWTEQILLFKSEIQRLVGDIIILTGFLSYCGPFNQQFRSILQNAWQHELQEKGIPSSLNVPVIERLTDTATIGEWNLEGLPNDELSTQNGIIVTQAHRYPLLIDPQSQGKSWIKQKEKENLRITTIDHKYFRNTLEDAISQGFPILIEDVGEELDPCLDNVLEKNYVKLGNSFKVKVGDKEIDVHPDFKLYITTKMPNPTYRPEISASTSVIDFTVTIKGLEDQLLGRVILSERSSIEEERVRLDTEVTANKKLSKELEANLLYKLSTTEGSLLDDLSVMEVLNNSKSKAIEIAEKLESSDITKKNINDAREEFRPVAARGSVLYFLIVKMSQVNTMYQTSLVQFLKRFDYSLQKSDKTPLAVKRIKFIVEFLTYDIFKYKSRELYESHKLLFVLLMALDIDLQRKMITFDEFQYFLKGGAALDISSCPQKTAKWITDSVWLDLVQLSNLRNFNDILNDITLNDKLWSKWYAKRAPEDEQFPGDYDLLDVFRKLLIIRAICPDRTLSQSKKYIAESLGTKFAESVVLDFETMIEEGTPLTPIICFLSMGGDPTPLISGLAKKNKIKFSAISMGQGQEIHARQLIEKSWSEGSSWVLLQNCHLGLEFMNELILRLINLEDEYEKIQNDPEISIEIKEKQNVFRLWITTEIHPDFPVTLLQTSIKYTNEPPSGVRAGLIRTYNAMPLDLFYFTDSKLYLPLIYATSFLHTIVQERRKYGAIGWNIPYEFNSADWLASCLFMQKHLEDVNENLNWKTINYMISEVQYGGRVTDDLDKRFLNCLSKTYFNDSLYTEKFTFYDGYPLVDKKTIEDYLEYFETVMPVIDPPPNIYFLHSNADITYQTNKTKDILATIVSVQPKESSDVVGETRESVVMRYVKDMISKLPQPYDEFEVKDKLAAKSTEPLIIFLKQEIDRMQKIILLVKATLNDLLLAIEGIIIMNEKLRDAFDNFYDTRVPEVWKRGSWTSSTLGLWFTNLNKRNNQYRSWLSATPISYWMTGFFNPQGFLTAMRQETTRKNKGWALDKVILQNEITKFAANEPKEAPRSGIYVHGLYLEGANWVKRLAKLSEAANKVLSVQMPVIRIYANDKFDGDITKFYTCPVYKKPNRTDLNFITYLYLPIDVPPDHWILRGVAMLCDIE